MKSVSLVRGREEIEYQAPAMELWLGRGLRTPGVYEESCDAYLDHVQALPEESKEKYEARHALYRLALSTIEMKDNLRNEAYKIRAVQEQFVERGASLKTIVGVKGKIAANRLQRLQGQVPLEYIDWDVDFMVSREVLHQAGIQCPAEYMRDGFREWEKDPEALSVNEYLATGRHYNLCSSCAIEWVKDDWKYGPVNWASYVLGESETLATMRAASRDRRDRLEPQ